MSPRVDQPVTLAPPVYADVEAAARRLDGVAHRTPVMTSRTANARTGAELFFKMESLQRTGAFKFRGAYNAIAALDPESRARGVVAFSSGNHAQAIAHAGALLGAPVTVVMPSDAPAIKVAATKGYGGEVVLYDRFTEDREAIGRRLAAERGLSLVPPFDHPHVIAGQGTATKELIEEVGRLDRLYICLGGGGLTSGGCLAAAALSPGCAVYGVEPEAGDDFVRSLAEGRPVTIPVPKTIADGAQTTTPGGYTFPIVREMAAGVVTASDAALVDAMRFFAERMKQVVEPTGCLAAAAAFADGEAGALAGLRVGVIVSGGNVDLARFASLVAG